MNSVERRGNDTGFAAEFEDVGHQMSPTAGTGARSRMAGSVGGIYSRPNSAADRAVGERGLQQQQQQLNCFSAAAATLLASRLQILLGRGSKLLAKAQR